MNNIKSNLKKYSLLGTLVTASLFSVSSYASSAMTGLDVIKLYDENRRANSETAEVEFTLRNVKGNERKRIFSWYIKDRADSTRDVLVKFSQPKDIENTGFLIKEHLEKDNDRWLYLPALKRVRRISSGDKSDSFVGSDFLYEDFEMSDGAVGQKKRSYKIISEETVNGDDCWVVESITVDPDEKLESAYGKRILWISKKSHVAIKTEYYDQQMVKFQEMQVTEMKEVIDGKYRAIVMEKTSLKTNHKTIVKWSDFKIDHGLKDSLFSKRALKNKVRL